MNSKVFHYGFLIFLAAQIHLQAEITSSSPLTVLAEINIFKCIQNIFGVL